jgi:pre-mRNA-splicing factor CWC26
MSDRPAPTTTLSKQEYLKKYLSKPGDGEEDAERKRDKKDKKKRKKERHHHSSSSRHGMRIIDDDIDFGRIAAGERELYSEDEEEKPAIDAEVEGPGSTDPSSYRRQISDGRASSKRPRHDSPDASPPRRGRDRHDSPDASPPRRGRDRHDSPDASPPRRGRDRHDSPDASPPRRDRRGADNPRRASGKEAMPPPPPPPAASGVAAARASFAQAGLHTNVAQEAAALQAAAAAQPSMSEATLMGAGEDTIYRDRKGRKLEMLSEMMKTEGSGQAAGPVKPVWGSGLAQQRSKEEQRDYERREAAKPLARYEIDADLDAEKRAAMRWDDPMAKHLSSKSAGPSKPKYRGPPPPPNRFDILPGHRWDGVDRSNGYEKQFFQAHAKARRQAQEAHSWATADM